MTRPASPMGPRDRGRAGLGIARAIGLGLALLGGCRKGAEDVVYVPGGDPVLQALDVHAPGGWGARPVVLWVHGGAWQTGDKREDVRAKTELFTQEGWVFVSTNYRLSPYPTDVGDVDRVMHPAHVQDVAAALAWVHAHVADHGGDPGRVALLGSSAGAHLVSLLALDGERLAEAGLDRGAVRCVVSVEAASYDLVEEYEDHVSDANVFTNAFGEDRASWEDASPTTWISGEAPPFLVTRRDTERSALHAAAFTARLEEAGVPVERLDAGSLAHGDVAGSIGKAGDDVVTPPLMDWLRECLGEG